MKNIAYSLFFTLWTALPSSQNTTKTGGNPAELEVKVAKIIQQKQDSIYNQIDSLRYDVQEIKTKQERLSYLRSIERKLDKQLNQIKEEKQYKRITEEFDF